MRTAPPDPIEMLNSTTAVWRLERLGLATFFITTIAGMCLLACSALTRRGIGEDILELLVKMLPLMIFSWPLIVAILAPLVLLREFQTEGYLILMLSGLPNTAIVKGYLRLAVARLWVLMGFSGGILMLIWFVAFYDYLSLGDEFACPRFADCTVSNMLLSALGATAASIGAALVIISGALLAISAAFALTQRGSNISAALAVTFVIVLLDTILKGYLISVLIDVSSAIFEVLTFFSRGIAFGMAAVPAFIIFGASYLILPRILRREVAI